MSAVDPLVVNTQDGCCWTRRAVNRAGRGLYALADVRGPVPELVLASLAELAEHGLASMADVLPVPVGPEPQALSGPICSQAEARAAGLDIAPSVAELDAMAETIVAAGDPLSAEVSLAQAVPLLGAAFQRLRADVESARVDDQRLIRAEKRRAELEAVLSTHRKDDQAEIERLLARVDEVELAYAFDTAELKRRVAELEAGSALPWAAAMSDADLHLFLGDLVSAAIHYYYRDPETPDREVLRLVELACANWRTPGQGLREDEPEPPAEVFVPRTERSYWVAIADALNAAHDVGTPVGIDLDGTLTDRNAWSVVWDRDAERWTVTGYDDAEADGITRRIAPTQALREDPHDGPLHHDYRVGRDLPETGGAQ